MLIKTLDKKSTIINFILKIIIFKIKKKLNLHFFITYHNNILFE